MNPISVANTISSSPPARPLPRPGYAYPVPSAPPLDDVFYTFGHLKWDKTP